MAVQSERLAAVFDSSLTQPSPASEQDRAEVFAADAGVLLVHGMGAQRKNETLLEWAEPIVRRIEYLLRGVCTTDPGADAQADSASVGSGEPREQARTASDQKVRFVGVDIGSNSDSQVLITHPSVVGSGSGRTLLIREALWSEAFLPLGRAEVFAWSFRFAGKAIWKATGHFVRMMQSRIGAWAWPLSGALIALTCVLWLLVMVSLPALSVLLFVPGAAALARRVVTALTEFIGDPAVLLSRPVRAAAMRQVVADRLRELYRDLAPGAPITVIAHSQGAAIAAEVIFGDASVQSGELAAIETGPAVQVTTLFTVGSGVNLLGEGYTSREQGPLHRMPVRNWIKKQNPTTWVNIWASWDAVSAGPVGDSDRDRRRRFRALIAGVVAPSPGPRERLVRNTANPFADHQSYPQNIIEVIDPIARTCIGMPIDAPEEVAQASARRSWVRVVRIHGIARIAILALAAMLVWMPAELLKPAQGLVGAALDVDSWSDPWRGLAQLVANLVLFGASAAFGLWCAGRVRAGYMRRLQWDISDGWTGFASNPITSIVMLALLGVALSASAWLGAPSPGSGVTAGAVAAIYAISLLRAASVGRVADLGDGQLPR